jgi:hypothetical protein
MSTRIRITRISEGEDIARRLVPAMANLGEATGSRMQRLVPKRTWALHDTISAETQRDGAVVTTTVGFGSDDVDYGLLVERGTSRMAAQPFARPALLQTRAGDLRYTGAGITTHGVTVPTTRRSRTRQRRESS